MLSAVLRFESAPFATVMSPRSRPTTASEKVTATVEVSPVTSKVSVTVTVAVGAVLSMLTC